MSRRSVLHNLIFTFLTLLVVSCETSPRSFGYLNLGRLTEIKPGYSYLEEKAMLVIYDEGGYAAMSTYSPYDRSRLILVTDEKGNPSHWKSDFSESEYEFLGKVRKGPASKDLEYFEVVLDNGTNLSVKDTLYVKLGSKKSPDWRFVPSDEEIKVIRDLNKKTPDNKN